VILCAQQMQMARNTWSLEESLPSLDEARECTNSGLPVGPRKYRFRDFADLARNIRYGGQTLTDRLGMIKMVSSERHFATSQ
jgi:hypothetical protein